VILAFSTSSKMASVAVLSLDGSVVFEGCREADRRASEVCLQLVQESGVDLASCDFFLADLGPGSFTGTRVGVMLAKTFAYTFGAECGGADAFDLISHDQTVVFPSKRGEWFVRQPGSAVVRQVELPEGEFVGFGPGIEHEVFPEAARFAALLSHIARVPAVALVPEYLIEPSISIPKKAGVLPV
jgi:tRNA threonylcarbamoyl adenosine modification protein YeaZ